MIRPKDDVQPTVIVQIAQDDAVGRVGGGAYGGGDPDRGKHVACGRTKQPDSIVVADGDIVLTVIVARAMKRW